MMDQAVKTRAGVDSDLNKFNNRFNRTRPHDFSFLLKFTPYFNKFKLPLLATFRSKLLDYNKIKPSVK